jgi:hypothetical protein
VVETSFPVVVVLNEPQAELLQATDQDNWGFAEGSLVICALMGADVPVGMEEGGSR